MPQISQVKKEKISEQILAHLFNNSPNTIFTAQIAREIARDEEFTKTLLQDLEKNKLVVKVTKSPNGADYTRRQRWRLSNTVYEAYSKHQ
jgi:prolyl-tRNA editing enzyme YbaK/EbsC (Cys-tRNA(Pro) deacylase)